MSVDGAGHCRQSWKSSYGQWDRVGIGKGYDCMGSGELVIGSRATRDAERNGREPSEGQGLSSRRGLASAHRGSPLTSQHFVLQRWWLGLQHEDYL